MPKDPAQESRAPKSTPKKKTVAKPKVVATSVSAAPKRKSPADAFKPEASTLKPAAKTDNQNSNQIHVARVPHHEVAELAYNFWSQRGGQHGQDFSDWVRAEEHLKAQKAA